MVKEAVPHNLIKTTLTIIECDGYSPFVIPCHTDFIEQSMKDKNLSPGWELNPTNAGLDHHYLLYIYHPNSQIFLFPCESMIENKPKSSLGTVDMKLMLVIKSICLILFSDFTG